MISILVKLSKYGLTIPTIINYDDKDYGTQCRYVDNVDKELMACISRWTSELNSKTLPPPDSGTSPILTNLSPLYLNISIIKSKSA